MRSSAVAGKVLGAGQYVALAHAPHKGQRPLEDPIRVAGEGAGVDDGVAPVEKYVGNRGKVPVAADGRRLAAADLARQVGDFVGAGGAGHGVGGHQGPVGHPAVAPRLAVGGDEERDGAVLLEVAVLLVQVGGRSVRVADPAEMASSAAASRRARGRFMCMNSWPIFPRRSCRRWCARPGRCRVGQVGLALRSTIRVPSVCWWSQTRRHCR